MKDLTGLKFHRLTVLCKAPKELWKNKDHSYWFVQCDCGTQKVVAGRNLETGQTKSCGCLRKEFAASKATNKTKHGHSVRGSVSRTYRSWRAMKDRCLNPNSPSYPDYGGRGITIDPLWNDFSVFLEQMGERPENTSLDRINNNGNYTYSNCRWSNFRNQNNNRRKKVKLRDYQKLLKAFQEIGGDISGL